MFKIVNDNDNDNGKIKKQRGRPKGSTITSKKNVLTKTIIDNPKEFKKKYIVIFKINQDDIKKYKVDKNNSHLSSLLSLPSLPSLPHNSSNTYDFYNDICSLESQSINVKNFYNKKIVPLHTGNVPIKLFEMQLNNSDIENDDSYIKKTKKANISLLKYENDSKWPLTSEYACLNCSCYFDGTPIGIPTKIIKDKIICKGNFCDFGCLLRCMYETLTLEEFNELYPYIYLMYSIMYEIDLNDCKEELIMALPKITMKKYGGYLTDEEYHNFYKNNKKKIVEIAEYPFIPAIQRIYDVNIQSDLKLNFKKTNLKNQKIVDSEKPFIPINVEMFEKSKMIAQGLKRITF